MSEIRTVAETEDWAVIEKPHGLPSAPLEEGEAETALSIFLASCPEADAVRGKKPVERGLLHRLDTGTRGLILIAKTQSSYDALERAQQDGLIRKGYFALCDAGESSRPPQVPYTIISAFRPFGPGRREVRPVFPGQRGFDEGDRLYRTDVTEIALRDGVAAIFCELVRGYRHQVRSHLAHLGYPILGDPLYNDRDRERVASGEDVGPLQLHAIALSFPDPRTKAPVSVSLPRPSKTNR